MGVVSLCELLCLASERVRKDSADMDSKQPAFFSVFMGSGSTSGLDGLVKILERLCN